MPCEISQSQRPTLHEVLSGRVAAEVGKEDGKMSHGSRDWLWENGVLEMRGGDGHRLWTYLMHCTVHFNKMLSAGGIAQVQEHSPRGPGFSPQHWKKTKRCVERGDASCVRWLVHMSLSVLELIMKKLICNSKEPTQAHS
jgi:hypothetical protein